MATMIPRIDDLHRFTEITEIDEFLKGLGEPTWIYLKGKDPQRVKVITTLLHGNEPSGVLALKQLIQEQYIPEVSCWVLLANIDGALTQPLFSQRLTNTGQDLNRCFNPSLLAKSASDEQQQAYHFAQQILADIKSFKPEAVVDMHNTSGDGPDFCVASTLSQEISQLAKLFSKRLVLTNLTLGSLMEAEVGCPIITLECGGNQSITSHRVAYRGIKNYLMASQQQQTQFDIDYFRNPQRCQINKDSKLRYAKQQLSTVDLTLCSDILSHNFGETPAGELLGWYDGEPKQIFSFTDSKQEFAFDQCFECKAGEFKTRRPIKLFMITPDIEIARRDCLFYYVADY
jgi:hypothetical protein